MSYSLNWDLDSIFEGGSESVSLKKRLSQLEEQTKDYATLLKKWQPANDAPTYSDFQKILQNQDEISNGLSQAMSYVVGLQSANVNDKKANSLLGEIYQIATDFQNAATILAKKLTGIEDTAWQTLIASENFALLAFPLNEIRTQGKELLSEAEENILNQLSIDGFTAWSNHYETLVASIEIPFTEKDGTEVSLSAGQAFNRMMGDADASTRKTLFEKWEKTWGEKAPLFADTLNHLDGFRLTDYKLHGVTDFLKRPLEYNHMKKETLDVMWETISQNKTIFVDYLTRKAALFGKEKMEWQDQDAPIIVGDFKERRYTFQEAADFIIENFAKFSPKMSEFAKYAFEHRWIEAEDRPGKRPGGYCTNLPESKESRIFMTYGESINEVSTLAHELGHAFHSQVMWDLPAMLQDYAMNVAETASTFAELIVADATLQTATSVPEKINLIDVKMQNAIAMFCNIHARFIFEKSFYAARQKGVPSDEEITELMLTAQKEAYQEGLGSYHPHFWCAKMHFYFDDVPFYNFPYTFGYLFSLGIYAYANNHEDGFENQYIALLRDTAAMTTEELAAKHLGVDLTKPEFWQAGIDILKQDIQEFLTITEDYL